MNNLKLEAVHVAAAAGVVLTLYAVTAVAFLWGYGLPGSLKEWGEYSTAFGALTALFSTLGFLLVLGTLVLQQDQLRLTLEQLRQQSASQARQMHFQLQQLAIDHSGSPVDEQGKTPLDLTGLWDWGDLPPGLDRRAAIYLNLNLSQWEELFSRGLLDCRKLDLILRHQFRKKEWREFWQWAGRDEGLRAQLAIGDAPSAVDFHNIAWNAWRDTTKKVEPEGGRPTL